MEAVDCLVVADAILQHADAEGIEDIGNTKINKLVYIAHGWHLGWFGVPLVKEHVEVWTHGPVIPSLFYCVKYAGGGANPLPKEFFKEHMAEDVLDQRSGELLERVCSTYCKFPAWKLVSLTHMPYSPWSKAKSRGLPLIPDGFIRSYYKPRVKKFRKDHGI